MKMDGSIYGRSWMIAWAVCLGSGMVWATEMAQTHEWRYKGKFVITRYTSDERCCGKWADGYTYSGTRARYGVVAVDPRVIPLGSLVRVEGFKGVVFKAEDIGGAIKGNKMDIWHYNYDYCLRWGKQRRDVWVSARARTAKHERSGLDQIGEAIVGVPKFLVEGIGGLIEAIAG